MTIRLTVQRERWWQHVAAVAADTTGLIPVVKGNGYGFSRAGLAKLAVKLSDVIAVGTVYELSAIPPDTTAVVLTPALFAPPSNEVVMTVGDKAHIDALAGWGGRVIVKLTSEMKRYGGGIELVESAQRAGLRTVGVSIHPPLAGTDADHRRQIVRWLPQIDRSLDIYVSHLSPSIYAALPQSYRWRLRSGTYLWLGDRDALTLEARVLQTRPVSAGERVGYRLNPVAADGILVMVGAGTANGVYPLDDGRSPFHFKRQRLALVEAPHMHTSMVLVPHGQVAPMAGEWVDLQRPLTQTIIDELNWI